VLRSDAFPEARGHPTTFWTEATDRTRLPPLFFSSKVDGASERHRRRYTMSVSYYPPELVNNTCDFAVNTFGVEATYGLSWINSKFSSGGASMNVAQGLLQSPLISRDVHMRMIEVVELTAFIQGPGKSASAPLLLSSPSRPSSHLTDIPKPSSRASSRCTSPIARV